MRNLGKNYREDNKLGADTMHYLYNAYNKYRKKDKDEQTDQGDYTGHLNRVTDPVRWSSTRITNPISESSSASPLRLLNKFAADDKDYGSSKPEDNFFRRPISENVRRYRDFVKSPIIDSLIAGGLVGGLSYGASKFFNPDTDEVVAETAREMVRADKKNKSPLKTSAQYIQAAKDKLRRDRLITAGIVALGSAGVNSWFHSIPNHPKTWYKWSHRGGLNKKSSMLDGSLNMDINEVKAAVLDSPMTDGNKFMSMSMLNTINQPTVNSNDIIGAAIGTGASALAGAPIGRYTVAAVADAALGYGVGKLMGISAPGRLAAVTGIGSFILRSLADRGMR